MSKVTEQRKEDHIRINLEEDVQFPNLTTGLENYRFQHRALPELALSDIDTSVQLFGKELSSPLFISSMTGGTGSARRLNRTLAQVAEEYQLAMGVGSMRAALEDAALAESFEIRDVAPTAMLFANLGAVQLNYGYGVDHCRRAVDMIEADALILHFNVLQEAVQPEGDTDFSKLAEKIAELTSVLGVPVIAKEVGWGFSPQDIQLLQQAGIAAVDVAGAGGTSWSEVEYHRAPTAFHAQVARSFIDWGIPTADALNYMRETAPELTSLASGGIRDGIDIAKCVALGASLVGVASSFLKAAHESIEAVREYVDISTRQLEVAMLCAGARDIKSLQSTPLLKIK